MSYTTVQDSFYPSQTPKALKLLIAISSLTTILAALLDPLLIRYHLWSLQDLFCLSWAGLDHYFLWQPFTYLFIDQMSFEGVTGYLIFQLFFQMYFLWLLGVAVAEYCGIPSFLRLFFISSILSGGLTLGVMWLTSTYAILGGNTASLFALFTVWTMLFPDRQILLFFLFPIQTRWLFVGIVAVAYLIQLSHADFVGFSLLTSGILCGYLYATTVQCLHTPFLFTLSLDQALARLGGRFFAWRDHLQTAEKEEESSSKIIDFKTGKPVEEDELFVDRMLAKISEKGEASLTKQERERLNKIAEKKRT